MSLGGSRVRPCASCTVAPPASFRPSTIARSVRGVFRTTSGTCLLLSPRLVCHPPALLAALTETITTNCRHDHTCVFYVSSPHSHRPQAASSTRPPTPSPPTPP